ncbi:PREDICTED: G-protein-signaling modulator 2-like [Amphimedon queenslandica]|uniref:Uncharacterized protein n=1 Tax=Amphimedon queenslandica TaxID=400682 RepID=A0A1X7U499_AMPQE|nr:PREDICTED: G-protein-signaling modulator 2-like [Amphimedon queenslandica]|eukprot:XP_019856151.1 PREDICTED: G-protein-signaling modulator 2-like [Amphimedon queenslandica]
MMEVAGDYYKEREKEEEVDDDDVEKKVKQYHRRAQELQRIHKYNKAINYCQFSLNLMKGKPLNSLVGELYYTLANSYHRQGKKQLKGINSKEKEGKEEEGEEEKAGIKSLHISLHYYNICMQCSSNEAMMYWKSVEGLGNVHHLMGNYREAIAYHGQFLDYSVRAGDVEAQQRTNTNLGHAYLLLGEAKLSHYYHWESLELSIYLKNHVAEAQSYYSLGALQLLVQNHKEALKYFKKHLYLAQELNDKYGQCKSYWCIGKALTSLGHYKSALLFANKQFLLAEEICDYSQCCTARKNMSDLLDAISKSQKKIQQSEVGATGQKRKVQRSQSSHARTSERGNNEM